MSTWLAANKRAIFSVLTALLLSAIGAWAFLYESLPGGVWHRNRITGAICYETVHCWSATKDPFGKGLKLPSDPFGKIEE